MGTLNSKEIGKLMGISPNCFRKIYSVTPLFPRHLDIKNGVGYIFDAEEVYRFLNSVDINDLKRAAYKEIRNGNLDENKTIINGMAFKFLSSPGILRPKAKAGNGYRETVHIKCAY